MNNNMEKIMEGKTQLFIPKDNIINHHPQKFPAFFNPLAKFNRNISIGIYKAFTQINDNVLTFADCLSGVGSRGLRVAVEIPKIETVYMNDFNKLAIDLACKSSKINNVNNKCNFSLQEVEHFLISHSSSETKFNILDLDPFGSPSRYIDIALRSLQNNGLLSITATDTAVLCGVYPTVSKRKYGGKSLKTEYCHELAVRLLIGSIASAAAKLDIGIYPLFSHFNKHYVRAYVNIKFGIKHANQTLLKLGYINHCSTCGHRLININSIINCEYCNVNMHYSGPLWVGELSEKKIIKQAVKNFEEWEMHDCVKLMTMSLNECIDEPTYFVVHDITHKLKVICPPLDKIIDNLQDNGYQASRTIFNPNGIKTNCTIQEFKEIIKDLSI